MNIFDGDLKAVKTSGFRRCDFGREVATEILFDDAVGSRKEGKNMPSEAAKKARTCMMKCCSVVKSRSQSTASLEMSISSAVQKEASAFLCILHCRCVGWGRGRSNEGSLGGAA